MTSEQVLTADPEVLAHPKEGLPTKATISLSFSEGLTKREVEVLRLLAQGSTNLEMAEVLVIAPETVKAHLKSIFSKLGVTNRTAARDYSHKQNLI
jgi:DNA-binding NarL/FixJ family response regulator